MMSSELLHEWCSTVATVNYTTMSTLSTGIASVLCLSGSPLPLGVEGRGHDEVCAVARKAQSQHELVQPVRVREIQETNLHKDDEDHTVHGCTQARVQQGMNRT